MGKEKNEGDTVGSPEYLEHGLVGETYIYGKYGGKMLKDLRLHDDLGLCGKVVGLITIDGSILESYLYEGVILSSNMKVQEDGIWKSVEKCKNAKKLNNIHRFFYNIVTDKGYIETSYGLKMMDYLEVRDETINGEIDKILN